VRVLESSVYRVRVLAAEDNPINRNVLVALLHLVGITPVLVANGAELLAEWRSSDWDLVLTDVEMPEINGLDATRIIRTEEATRRRWRTPIIAITAHSPEELEAKAMRGFDAVVAKPIEIKPFLKTIEDVLSRARAERMEASVSFHTPRGDREARP
jgi:CheY-like chemotaxis protein